MQAPPIYSLSEALLQAVIRNLESQPAAQSRHLLNVIESECLKQDQEREKAARAAEIETLRGELKAEIEQKLDDRAHTSAPPLPDIPAQAPA
jgi:hypothetical protein